MSCIRTNVHAPPLRRELTLISSAALVISNMIGTGIFTTTGYLARDLIKPNLVLGIWLVGGVISLAGCLSYAELGVNFPSSGGEYVYLREIWGPLPGFLSGWVSFFAGFCAPVAASALAFSEYLARVFPSGPHDPTHTARFFAIPQSISITVILFFAGLNVIGLRPAARIQNLLTALKLTVLSVFLALAFAVGHGNWRHFRPVTTSTSPLPVFFQFAVSLVFVMFAYSGWNAATYVTEEMKDPECILPPALLIGTALVTLYYIALNVAFIYALPLQSLKGVEAVGAVAASGLFGSRAGTFFSGIMAVALLSCVSAMSLTGPRVYYAMAKDGCFPSFAAEVYAPGQTPAKAILAQAFVACFMVLTGTFEALIYYIGFTLVLFAALAVAGIFRGRRRTDWHRLRAVSWAYPAIPLLFVLASAWMLTWTLVLRPRESGLGVLTVIAGALFYRWKVHKTAP